MRATTLLALVVSLALLAALSGAAAARTSVAPVNNGCSAGGGYDPACDVNHDDQINVTDIQLTAGHWGDSGDWTSDHDHLGDTWLGNNNPLRIQGSFEYPVLGALEVSNSAGNGLGVASATGSGLHVYSSGAHGLHVQSVSAHGVAVNTANYDGLHVEWAGGDGLNVCSTGTSTSCSSSPEHNGVEIGNSQDHGVYVSSAGGNGFAVADAQGNGLRVDRADTYGVYVASARNGIRVDSVDTAGLFEGTAISVGTARWGVMVGDTIQEAFAANHAGFGLIIREADYDGVSVYDAGQDGVDVRSAGNPSALIPDDTRSNGLEVAGAQGHGLYVGQADINGVQVQSAGYHGVYVGGTGQHGVKVDYPTLDGLFVNAAGQNGVSANTTQSSGEWGLHTEDKIHGSNVTLSSLTVIAQVANEQTLNPGDVAAAVGVTDPLPGSTVSLALVQPATAGNGIIGVVEGRMVLTPKPQHEDEKDQEPVFSLRSAEGPATAGNYVAITVLGVAQVKVDTGMDIQPGQRLTTSDTIGHARGLKTVEVEGVRLAEDASIIGVALSELEEGQETIPVFVMLP